MACQNLPPVNLSVKNFCSHAKRLLGESHADFVNFVLTGTNNGRQAVIDPILDSVNVDESLSIRRDYDSVLGISRNIAVTSSITVFPLARKEDTLTKNIHLSYHFTNSSGSFTVPVHTVPNLCLGKWRTHNMIRVLIPELYRHGRRTSTLTQEEQKIFYEQGLRPAAQYLLGEQADEWPSTYNDEMFRARGRNGQLSFQSKQFPAWRVAQLGNHIRSCLELHGSSWGVGLVFLHQIRGVKHSTAHAVDGDSAQVALDEFITEHDLDLTTLRSSGEWWIDVGAEVSSNDENCLAWRTDSHFHVVQRACNIEDYIAHRITKVGSSKYTRDPSSHLIAVSGCRISPGVRARGPYDVQYFQQYITDKALTYRPDQGHHGKFITCSDILKGKATEYIDNLYRLYGNAINTTRSLARVEVRVPLRHACHVLLDLDEDLLRGSLVSFNPSVWWSLRSYRALALKYILEWQAEGDNHLRTKDMALLLTAAAMWLLNGLHSAPDKGASSKELMAAILPHVERAGADPDILAYGTPTDDDDVASDVDLESDSEDDQPPPTKRRRDAVTMPSFPYGLVFLRAIRLGEPHPVPRFSNGQFISVRAFKYIFGVEPQDVESEFFRNALVDKAHPTRVRNKIRRTPIYHNWGQEHNARPFNLAARGYELPPPARDGGSDLEDDDEDAAASGAQQEGGGDVGGDIDARLTNVWRQFLLDVTSKAPNNRRANAPSHCVLSEAERTLVTEATYKNRKLSDYFRDCQWKVAEPKDWQLIFDRFFPPKGHRFAGRVQNFPSTKYLPIWEDIKTRADDETYIQIRQAIRSRFDKLYWIPFAQTDRIWYTKFDPTFTKSSGFDRRAPSPLIYINGPAPTEW